jgi:hypothetical protein
MRKFFELLARNLDGLQLVGELGHASETGNLICGPKSRWLSSNRDIHGPPHFANNGEHTPGILFAVGPDKGRTSINHCLSAPGRGGSITAFSGARAKAHGCDNRQSAGTGTFKSNQDFVQMKEGLENQKIDSSALEQTNLLGDKVSNQAGSRLALPFKELGAGY